MPVPTKIVSECAERTLHGNRHTDKDCRSVVKKVICTSQLLKHLQSHSKGNAVEHLGSTDLERISERKQDTW